MAETTDFLHATSDSSLSSTSTTFTPTSTVELTPPPTADGSTDNQESFRHATVEDDQEEQSDRMTRTTSYSSIDSDSSDSHLLNEEKSKDGPKKRTRMRRFGSIVLYTVYFAVCLAIGAGILLTQVCHSRIPDDDFARCLFFRFGLIRCRALTSILSLSDRPDAPFYRF